MGLQRECVSPVERDWVSGWEGMDAISTVVLLSSHAHCHTLGMRNMRPAAVFLIPRLFDAGRCLQQKITLCFNGGISSLSPSPVRASNTHVRTRTHARTQTDAHTHKCMRDSETGGGSRSSVSDAFCAVVRLLHPHNTALHCTD